MADEKSCMTPIGTICFPALFEPKAPAQGGDPRYSFILGLDANALKTAAYQNMRKAVMAAITEKWGAAKAQDANFVRALRLPFRQAAEKDYSGFDKFEIFVSPWSKQAPGVIDVNGNKIVVPGDVWAGQLGRATVRAFAYENSGNKGVAFGLEHVQIVKADTERLDGRRSAESAFANTDDSEFAAYGIDPEAAKSAANSALSGGSSNDDLPF